MTLAEAKRLLEEVAVIDNRKLSQELVRAWHKIVGHVDYRVAERALLLARRDSAVTYLEPKHIVAKLPMAIAELNQELQAQEEDEDGEYSDRPVNYQEMEDFYRDLWRISPWTFQVRAGKSAKGNPVYRQLYGDELRVELEKAARKVGKTLPEPVFPNEPF